MAPEARIRLTAGGLPSAVSTLVRDARTTIGWSQRELAARVGTSQTKIWRIERADPGALDVATLDRVLSALGLRSTLEVEGHHLADRREQRDRLHARLMAAMAGRLHRCGWVVATEVPIGGRELRGWVDIVAYRAADAAMATFELKTDLPDIGGLQRQLDWYERAAPWVARRLGWRVERFVSAVICLDTQAVADRLDEHRWLLRAAFPGEGRALVAWLEEPTSRPPQGRAIAVTDLAARRGLGLRASRLHGRRARPAYRDYAEAATLVRQRKPPGRTSRIDRSRNGSASPSR
jgi:transcriptional regulator with XRE-family HTH domain